MARTLADMTPEQAQDALENLRLIKETPIIKGRHDEGLQEMKVNALHAATATRQGIRALETIAAMAEEVEYRIVNPDTNGGRYELRRRSRHVTEWSTDE